VNPLPSASPLAAAGVACAALAAAILVTYLVRRPALGPSTRAWLLLGLGVFPIAVAFTGNLHGYEATKKRAFCGSCHVMSLHAADADDPKSRSLAARHARSPMMGDENCYTCHADYGMFGTVVTKLGGMRHVWLYFTEYRDTPVDRAKETIHLLKPYPNSTCMQCHSTQTELWAKVPDHKSSLDDVRSGRVSCASEGCHGLAHPFFRPAAASSSSPVSEGTHR
jgi:cytochrome c-type protein NapC